MTRRVSFAHAARTEFMEAAAWYEARRPNLGVEFIAEIDRCVALARIVVLAVFHSSRDPVIWQVRA